MRRQSVATLRPALAIIRLIHSFIVAVSAMSRLILLNKPYGVICQFSEHPSHPTLKSCVPLPGVYPAGRLDTDSEGLLLLTGDGELQHRIANPRWKLPKTYWVQVEGQIREEQLEQLRRGVDLGDFTTQPAQARRIDAPICGNASRRCVFARRCRMAGWRSSSARARTAKCGA